jgi:hypothetical protein
LVRILLDRDLVPGDYDCRWDGLDDAGRRVPAGVYFILLAKPDQESRHKVVLQR